MGVDHTEPMVKKDDADRARACAEKIGYTVFEQADGWHYQLFQDAPPDAGGQWIGDQVGPWLQPSDAGNEGALAMGNAIVRARACAEGKPMPGEADAKAATVAVSAAVKKLNDAIQAASDFGVETTVSTRAQWMGARGSSSTLVKADLKLVLSGLEGEEE